MAGPMWRAVLALCVGGLTLGGCVALDLVTALPAPTETPAAAVATASAAPDGCGTATPEEIESPGMSNEFGRYADSWGRIPLEEGRPTITWAQAQVAGLAVRMPDLPLGLAVHRMDAVRPVRAMRDFLTTRPLGRDETFVGVLADGGAILTVSRGNKDHDLALDIQRFMQKRGMGSNSGIVTVAGRTAYLAWGDQRGDVRPYTIIWSDDDGVGYDLVTAFDDGVDVVNLARAIGCAQSG